MISFFHLLEASAMAKRFATALTTTRSFRLSLLLIDHNFAQLPGALREMVLGNCDLMAIFRTNSGNAGAFGDFLPEIDPEEFARAWANGEADAATAKQKRLESLQRLPNRQCYWYDRRKAHRALRLRVSVGHKRGLQDALNRPQDCPTILAVARTAC